MRTPCSAASALILAAAAAAQPPSWRLRIDWESPGLNPIAWGHAFAYDAARRVCVSFGGVGSTDTWTWNGQAWTRLVTAAPSRRLVTAMAYDSDRAVCVLYGGYGWGTATPLDDTWEWNGQTWTQRQVSGPGPRAGHGMAFDSARGVMVLHGGEPTSDTWEFDGQAWALAATGPGGSAKAMAFDAARQRTMIVNDTGTWGYDGLAWALLAPAPITPNTSPSLVYDSDRALCILFAGAEFDPSTTHEWNGTSWQQTAQPYPLGRPDNSMAYDSFRKRTVLFGGRCFCDSGAGPEVWEYGLICRADCDGFSSPAALNVRDFACFLNEVATASGQEPDRQLYHYANCDGSTIQPVINIADFACFLNSFAAGCSI